MKFRLHITCSAGHTTYRDYTRRINAVNAWQRDWTAATGSGWYATHIESLCKQ